MKTPTEQAWQKFHDDLEELGRRKNKTVFGVPMELSIVTKRYQLLNTFLIRYSSVSIPPGNSIGIEYKDKHWFGEMSSVVPYRSQLLDYYLTYIWWPDREEYSLTLYCEEKIDHILGLPGEQRNQSELRAKADPDGFVVIAKFILELEYAG